MFFFKEYLSSRKNQLILVILSILLVSWFVNARITVTKSQLSINDIQQQIQTTQLAILNCESNIKDGLNTVESKSELNMLKENLPLFQIQKKAIQEKNYTKFYDAQYEINKNSKDKSQLDSSNSKSFNAWYNEVKASGQAFPEAQGEDPMAYSAFLEANGDLNGILILVLVSVLVSDFLSWQFPNKLRLWRVLKVKREKIQIMTLLVPIITVFSVVCFLFICYFIYLGFSVGWGSPKFPAGMFGEYSNMPVWQAGVWGLAYFAVILIFLSSLGQFLTLIVKRSFLPLIVTVLILVGYSQLMTQDFMKHVIKFIPLTYLGSGTVVQLSGGSPAPWPLGGNVLFGQNSLIFGVIYLLVLSLIFYIATHWLFQRYVYRKA
ncbi:MAG: hypothetical protein LBI43_06420 [Streptococcaceae bacterium]|jgi:hypothetical protein|nr:hypothetical protein [Streptococcaceae bacterium]